MFLKYEMTVIVRHLSKPRTLAVARRALDNIFAKNGFVYGVQSQGLCELPQRMRGDLKGSYFQFYFVAPTENVAELKKDIRFDPEVIRSNVFTVNPYVPVECSLEEELKPPALRASVQKMIKEGEDREPIETKVARWDSNTGLDHYPFST